MTVDDLRALIVARRARARIAEKSASDSTAIRNSVEDLAVLDRHRKPYGSVECEWCDVRSPCLETQSIARRYGKELT